MRVLHIDTGTGWRGGQQQVLLLLKGCRERGIEQQLLTPAGSPLCERALQSGIAVEPLSRRGLSLGNLRAVRRLASEADFIHAHDSHAHSLVCAAEPFGGAKPPLVVSRRVGFPIGSLGRSKYRVPALYIAVSEHVRWRLMDAGVPGEKIHVVYDGVPAPLELPNGRVRDEFRERHGAGAKTSVIGTLASFAPEKLLAEELRLLAQLTVTTHFWLGVPHWESDPGIAGTALLKEARRLGVAHRFQIIPVAENPGAFLTSLDLFLYLSRMEGLGSAILLAMAYELPVVASEVGGIPEIVKHGQTGVLVGEDFEHELPSVLQMLIAAAPLRRRLAAAARQFVFNHATSDKMIAQTVQLYQGLLQGSSEPPA